MARKNESPQKAAMREMMHSYLKENDTSIKNGTDVNAVMRDMMSVILEDVLDEELDGELGYSKYDYRNKDTDNSRNGHSKKTMHTSYGDMDIAIPRDRNGEYEPQLIKKKSEYRDAGHGGKDSFHVCKRHDNWVTLSTYFKYPETVRYLIYTMNAIEESNRQLRKVTKSKTVFPTDDSLLKMLYLAMMDITKKWIGHRQDWRQIHS